MREIVSIHVGQCGNQVGSAFWNTLLLEHEKTPDHDPALSSFFHFEPSKTSRGSHVMKARALLVDMECGPLNETMRSSLGPLFNEAQYIMDVSGSGNNFAQGYYSYGPQYHDRFLQGIHNNLEKCDSLQGFFLTHSLGGGTGSGVGSFILHLLADEFPKITRFSTCVYPSDDGDVITAPYNTLLATRELIRSADCVFPLNNSSLFAFNQQENPPKPGEADAPVSAMDRKSRSKGFEGVNNVAARMLCHLTSASRFHGEMNVDINEIYTNLVPFPRMHFLMTALNVRHPTTTAQAQRLKADHSRPALQRAFGDIMGNRGQLSGGISFLSEQQTRATPPTMLSSAFFARGKVTLSDFLHCVQHAQRNMHFPEWNQDACKIGMCRTPSPGEEMGVMGIYNSSSFADVLGRDVGNFQRLFRKKAMLHHYTEYVEEHVVHEAEQEVLELVADYAAIDQGRWPTPPGAPSNSHQNLPLFPAF